MLQSPARVSINHSTPFLHLARRKSPSKKNTGSPSSGSFQDDLESIRGILAAPRTFSHSGKEPQRFYEIPAIERATIPPILGTCGTTATYINFMGSTGDLERREVGEHPLRRKARGEADFEIYCFRKEVVIRGNTIQISLATHSSVFTVR